MPAASGYAALSGTAWVYDRILTVPEHRRRGLGAALMAAMGALKPSLAAVDVLTATPVGRELYRRLGWREVCPWTTARFVG